MRAALAAPDEGLYLGDYDGPPAHPDTAAPDYADVWPDTQSIASWPELSGAAAGIMQQPPPQQLNYPPRRQQHYRSGGNVEMQRLRAAEHHSDAQWLNERAAPLTSAAISLVGMRRRRPGSSTAAAATGGGQHCGDWSVVCGALILAAIAVGVGGGVAYAFWRHRPWPLRFKDSEWCGVWLTTAAVEIVVARLLFCTLVLSSATKGWCGALFWTALCLGIGTPAFALYLMLRLLRHGSLGLVNGRYGTGAAAAFMDALGVPTPG